LATGDYWWVASYGGTTGWVKERFLYGGSPVLEADFKTAPTEGLAPLAVDFTNRSIGDYSEMRWDFGDGVTSTIKNPVHIYTSGGIYTPTMTISGPVGDAQHQDVIRVTENGLSFGVIKTELQAEVDKLE
jgi:PKD repeat protein